MMDHSKYIALTLLLASLGCLLPCAESNPYVISDARARNMDITPVLGRGYSLMTNSFQSTCLLVEETTVPSFNYDYSYYDFTDSENLEVNAANKFSYSFGYWWFNGQVRAESTSNQKTETKKRYIASSMRIERYYSSLKEELSPLSDDAVTLLTRQDYVGFFKACGPTYIRGLRRAQEVATFFFFDSTSTESASKYAVSVQVSHWWYNRKWGYSYSNESKFRSESKSLKIIIKGYGLGLSEDGSETLVATDLQEHSRVMKFAFNSMTRIPNTEHIGMVYGMEVFPWANNAKFLTAAGVLDEAIEIPVERSVIPRAFRISDPSDILFDNTSEQTRALFRCKTPQHEMDQYGFCCESDALYDYARQLYDDNLPSERVCRPLKVLSSVLVKDNMAANGEFVARLDRTVRFKLNQLSTLERCISAIRSFPERYDYFILKSQDNALYDNELEATFSVFELKLALDPFNDFAMVKHMGKELDEFLDMYIQPCYSALFGTNIGNSPGTDPSFFMAYPWHTHPECTKLACLANSMRWDRSSQVGGGCVPSLISGGGAPSYDDGDDECSLDVESGVRQCKHNTTDLIEFHTKATSCWKGAVPRGRVDYLMEHFCMPSLTGDVLPGSEVSDLKLNYAKFCTIGQEFSINVAEGKPAVQSSTYPHYGSSAKAGLAVDGDIDGNMWRKSVSHTRFDRDPWWSVDLQAEYLIKEIVVYNRTDGSSQRLSGFVVTIYKNGDLEWTSDAQIGYIEYETKIPVNDVFGDQVKITLLGKEEFLQLAEVKVFNKFYA